MLKREDNAIGGFRAEYHNGNVVFYPFLDEIETDEDYVMVRIGSAQAMLNRDDIHELTLFLADFENIDIDPN